MKTCPQRPFELMMSILAKMPWYADDLITVVQRQAMFSAVKRMISALHKKIGHRDTCPVQLNKQLLDRLARGAMRCHGFSVVQKDDIAFLANLSAHTQHIFRQPSFARYWIHTWTLAPKPDVPEDLLEVSFLRPTLPAPSLIEFKPVY